MTNNRDKIADVLKRAIKGEDEGFFFYNLLAEKVANFDAKRKVENLRDDEARHKRVLLDVYQKYIGGEIGRLPEKGLSVLSEVFARGGLADLKSEMEFINLAIEAELATTRYYQAERDLVQDPEFHAIFDSLADEEHRHYELLMAERQALSGNYYWFSYDSTSPMED